MSLGNFSLSAIHLPVRSTSVLTKAGNLLALLLMQHIFKYFKYHLNLRLCPKKRQPPHPLIEEAIDMVNFNDFKGIKIMLINRQEQGFSTCAHQGQHPWWTGNNLAVRNSQVKLISFHLVVCSYAKDGHSKWHNFLCKQRLETDKHLMDINSVGIWYVFINLVISISYIFICTK